jgi:hypothetical protein
MKIYSSKILLYILGIITVGVVIYFVSKNIKKKNIIPDSNINQPTLIIPPIVEKPVPKIDISQSTLEKNIRLVEEANDKLKLEKDELVQKVKIYINDLIRRIQKVKSQIISVIGGPNSPDYPLLSYDFNNLDILEKQLLIRDLKNYNISMLNSVLNEKYNSNIIDGVQKGVQKQIEKELLLKDVNLFIDKLQNKIDLISKSINSKQNIKNIKYTADTLNDIRKYISSFGPEDIDISQLNKYLTDWLPDISNRLDEILEDEQKLNTQSEYYRYVL